MKNLVTLVGKAMRNPYKARSWLQKKIKKMIIGEKVRWAKCLVLGVPNHTNIGDSAITLAEISFLYQCGLKKSDVCLIQNDEYYEYRDVILKNACSRQVIFGHGGGNVGDEWIREEQFRQQFMRDFNQNSIIIFPQTVYFKNNSNVEACLKEYEHSNIWLLLREKRSFDLVRESNENINILLVPDMVLSLPTEMNNACPNNRNGVLLYKRGDVEQNNNIDWSRIIQYFDNKKISFSMRDMYFEKKIESNIRKKCVNDKMDEIASAKLIVTDRLHTMIFAALKETPCVVLPNYNHKISGVYEFLGHLPYIRYVENEEMVLKEIEDLDLEKHYEYNNKLDKYFDKLKKLIISKLR